MTDGVIVVDKPPGMTSHDVVDEIRRRFKTKRVGHAGTLDPDATGVLVLALGKATKLLPYAAASDKSYAAEARFGVTTSTQDASGEVSERKDASSLTSDDIARALEAFRGDLEQVPPMVSAVRVGGERLYEKARRGEEVEREARKVYVTRFDIIDFTGGEEAEASFEITCSAGTYVRTLIHDLGVAVGTGAHMTSLRRTRASGFSDADSVPLAAVERTSLRPALEIVRALARLDASDEIATLVADGRSLGAPQEPDLHEGQPVAIVRDSDVLAIYERRGHELRAKRVIPR
ncbi:MAG: tRNA pseudouridine(55) synthase TruB [Actinobacteria bacterium]|nr:tRNA pseudouridine(55) synthase TruB [Actinomycetota bacterium]